MTCLRGICSAVCDEDDDCEEGACASLAAVSAECGSNSPGQMCLPQAEADCESPVPNSGNLGGAGGASAAECELAGALACAYVTHCAGLDYDFNAKNNLLVAPADAASVYTDPDSDNFSLAAGSAASGAGAAVADITSSSKPDLGALEGGDRVLQAGASLDVCGR